MARHKTTAAPKARERRPSPQDARRPTGEDVAIGQRLRIRREELGLSRPVVAERLQLSLQQVVKYEEGRSRLSAGRLRQVAQVLGVASDWLLGLDAEKARSGRLAHVMVQLRELSETDLTTVSELVGALAPKGRRRAAAAPAPVEAAA